MRTWRKEYLPWWNQTLAVKPANAEDAHRPLGKEYDLAGILSHVEQRQVTNDYTVRYDGKVYQIDRQDIRTGMRKAMVRVEERLNETIAVQFQGRYVRVRRCANWRRPKRRRSNLRAQPASRNARATGWTISRSALAPLCARLSGCPMSAAEHRRSQRQMERRARPARRASRLIYPKAAAQRLHQNRSAHKNQNPQNGHLMARFDWGLGAVCFGASPVAAVFGSASGSATPPEHRIHFNPSSQAALLKQDISILP